MKRTDQEKLYEHVRKFILKQKISCPEAVYQSDRVIENAYDFIDVCCQIVGFYDDETKSVKLGA